MLTKTIQVPQIVFDTEKIKIGQKVKYYLTWTSYGIENKPEGVTNTDEIECIIHDVTKHTIILMELKYHTDYIDGREIVYHNIYKIKVCDIDKIKIIEN